MRRLLGWIWMLRRFGLRRTVAYWREGQRRGWMTEAEGLAFLESLRNEGAV